MSETYCGKSCQTCGCRAETSCQGCLEEASRECKLALCCRQKGHKTCDSCTYNTQCGMYRGRDTAPQFRLAQKQAVLEYQQSLREKGTVMTKWLWVLFWLFVPSTIASILMEWVPPLQTVGVVVSLLCSIVYGVVLLQLATQEQSYRTAGILTLIVALVNIPVLLIRNDIVAGMIVAIFAVVDLTSCYYEFNAHANVLEGWTIYSVSSGESCGSGCWEPPLPWWWGLFWSSLSLAFWWRWRRPLPSWLSAFSSWCISTARLRPSNSCPDEPITKGPLQIMSATAPFSWNGVLECRISGGAVSEPSRTGRTQRPDSAPATGP